MGKNKKQKDALKIMLNALKDYVGEEYAGWFLAILLDSLQRFVEGAEGGRELRTVEIVFNDFFSTKFNCSTKEYEHETTN